MSSTCQAVIERLSALHDEDLDVVEAEDVRKHLAACEPCRTRWLDFQSALSELRALPRAPVPAAFTEQVIARSVSSGAVSVGPAWPRRAAAAAGIALALLLLHSEWRRWGLEEQLRALTVARSQETTRIERWIEQADEQLNGVSVATRDGRDRLAELRTAVESIRARTGALADELARESEDQERRLLDVRRELLAVRAEVAARGGSPATVDLSPLEARLLDLERGFAALEFTLAARPPEPERPTREGPDRPADSGRDDRALAVSAPTVASPPGTTPVTDLAAGKACAVHREKGRYRLEVDWGHPRAVTTLFELFDDGQPEVRRLALAELDAFFAPWDVSVPATPAGAGLLGVMGNWFGREEPPAELDADQRRVAAYRRVWDEQPANKVRRGRS
ncbi:MAG: zf-HC2 domain-containing protein [Planctomycetota bacterium]